jgi:crossover junction endodeoxyribonuclease RuvC
MRILAIDGALNKSGWVIMENKNGEVKPSVYGTISTKPTMSLGFKLAYIRTEFIKIVKTYRPEVIIMEDTYSGKNALTNARLNNAKGVLYLTAYELLNQDPECVTAAKARGCVGFKNNKEEPFAYYQKLYKLKETFKQGNDITDACTLGNWYFIQLKGECKGKKKRSSTKKQ